ncbi:EAL domain-containing protein [Rhodoferax sp. GW822-FHT02A01]|uniref:EAL domain-containing protein n=1 Tax=Rhodoferax sp. GW822-FHT02A01 TaxID=3141537 RepID=UPI00315CBCA9
MATDSPRPILHSWQLGLVVALCGIAASALMVRKQSDSIDMVESARFTQAANSLNETLASRIAGYVEIALGLRGLFVVDPLVDRRSFNEAVTHLDVNSRYPGIKNIAFTRYVAAKDKRRFEAKVRADTTLNPRGYPNFAIHPPGDRSEYYVADYLWPANGNQNVQGLDISAQPANLASMQFSRRTGQPVASAPFDLIQETTSRSGFVIRVPVFVGKGNGGQEPKEEDFLGSVSITVRVFDLFQQLQSEGHFEGLRVAVTDMGSLLSNSSSDANTGSLIFSNLLSGSDSGTAISRMINVHGRKWQLQFQPERHFLSDAERRTPLLLGLAGTLISVLLGILVTLLARGRSLALAQAQASGEALKDSEQRWKFAVEGSGDGLWDWYIPSDVVYFSPRWKSLLGYADGDIGNQLDEFKTRIHLDDREHEEASKQAHLAGETPLYVSEQRLRCKDGSWKWILNRGVVVQRGHDGKPLRMIGTVRDITDKRNIEENLKRKNDLLTSIINNFPGGISAVNGDLTLLAHNELFARMMEFPASLFEIPNVGMEDFVRYNVQRGEYGPGDPQEQISSRINLARKFLAHRFERVRPNGTVLEVSGVPLPGGGFVSTYIDITERKHAEAQLRIAAASFESQEGMMVTDANQVILRVNRAFTKITGYAPEEIVGKKPSILKSGRHDSDFYHAMWESIKSTGGWQGEVWDRRKNGEIYPKLLTISEVKAVDGTVTHYIGTQYDISERKQTEKRIAELAFFDPLTHLPNRTLLLDRLAQSMTNGHRNGSYGAVLFIDLDNFKTLNDTLGHDKGDSLLQQVASRLTSNVREGDTVARLGGDEFVVVLGNLKGSIEEAASQAEMVASKILNALCQTYPLSDTTYRSTASLGVTLFSGHETSIEELLKQADLAMYKSKNSGRNAIRFFDPSMQTAVLERSAFEDDLRSAVETKQFILHYQVQVERNGEITGCEALVRWQHPTRGMVSPANFISVAEECGLIIPLGHWVLKTACTQLATWATQPDMRHLTLAVNVSVQQFLQSDFVNQVLAVIEATGANASRLKLELTESLLVDNVNEIIEKMVALKTAGVSFSLDDFGTGYSSLSYLKLLPLDQLKIDRSFVNDILDDSNDAAIAKTIVALAQILGMEVIAEGVENQAQCDFLRTLGCYAYQGYLFGRPLPVEAFESLVRAP